MGLQNLEASLLLYLISNNDHRKDSMASPSEDLIMTISILNLDSIVFDNNGVRILKHIRSWIAKLYNDFHNGF